MSKESVKKALTPHVPEINSILREAWNYFLEIPESARMIFPRTRANIVWEKISTNAINVFSQYENIQVVKIQGSLWYLLNDALMFRFKKGDRGGYTRNYPTQQSLAFHNPQSSLVPELERFEIVYVLNKTETDIEDILVVARKNNVIDYMYSILVSTNNVVPLEVPATQTDIIATSNAKLKKGVIVDDKIIVSDTD